MFTQIASLLATHFFSRLSPHGKDGVLTSLSMGAIRRVFIMISLALLAMTFFFGGFATVLVDLIMSSYRQDRLFLSPVSIVGFSLIVIAAIGLLVAVRSSAWHSPAARITVNETPSPLNEALAKLVLDFVEERKAARIHPEAADIPPETARERTEEPPPVYM